MGKEGRWVEKVFEAEYDQKHIVWKSKRNNKNKYKKILKYHWLKSRIAQQPLTGPYHTEVTH